MPNWVAITEDSLLTRISEPELTAFRGVALGNGQADPVADLISQVTDQVRRFVAGCPANQLNTGATIPRSLLSAALDAIVLELMKRPASTIMDDANGTRAKAGASAINLFRTQTPHGYVVEAPDDLETPAPIGSVLPSFTKTKRQFGKCREDGI